MEQVEQTNETVTVFGHALTRDDITKVARYAATIDGVSITLNRYPETFFPHNRYQLIVGIRGLDLSAHARTADDAERELRATILAECPRIAARLGLVAKLEAAHAG